MRLWDVPKSQGSKVVFSAILMNEPIEADLMRRCRALVSGLSMLMFLAAQGQQVVQRSLRWNVEAPAKDSTGARKDAASRVLDRDGSTKQPPMIFAEAFIDRDRGGLPFFHETIALPRGASSFDAILTGAEYVNVTTEEREAWGGMAEVGSEPEVHSRISWYRKQPQALLSVYPFRRDPATGQLEKMVSFRFELVETRAGGGAPLPKSYPLNSRLAQGEWYRFTVARDGVYSLTYNFLRELGVDVDGLSSDRINIYGNHFGMLPFENAPNRPTDLLPNAVEVVDGGDGNFGPGDHILFYATGAQRWELENGAFTHVKNVYSDSASYFVGIDIEPPFRVQNVALSNDAPTTTVTSFSERQFIERDLVNLVKSGRTQYGESFDQVTTYNFSFDTPFLVPGAPATLTVNAVARTVGNSVSSSFNVVSGSLNESFSIQGFAPGYTQPVARTAQQTYTFSPTGSSIPVTLSFIKADPITSVAWLDFLRINCRRQLRLFGDQLMFRDLNSVAPGAVSEFVLEQSQNIHRVWEITDPNSVGNVPLTPNGNDRLFRLRTDSLRQFIAFRNGGFLTPTKVGRVQNQDLHATVLPTELVIVAPPQFVGQAERLAQQRTSEGLTVRIVTLQQVYNEFSSGARDASAIKRYMRMLYDKAGNDDALMPRYLLLFGDGSYNNVLQAELNQNIIPTYQTVNSLSPTLSYTSDDYFGLLDELEGEAPGDLVDIGVGRLPVSNVQQARDVVTKILGYDRLKLLGASGDVCSELGEGGAADWRTRILFASDDQSGDGFEGPVHMWQSDTLAKRVELRHPCFNVNKIYLDAYQQISTPGGQRYPEANVEIRDRVQKGCLLVNYVGHGGEVGWAHERILDIATILGWTNADRLPLFMTATCEFSRWDDPGRTSAGEYVLLNPGGGGIGLMTTSRLAFSDQNYQLGRRFFDHVFQETSLEGRPQTFGDIFKATKRSISGAQPNSVNHRNFVLLGDPSQRLAMPRLEARITSVTDTLGNPMDTLKALSTVHIRGFVDGGDGQPMADFNGLVIPIVYDKAQQQATLVNDPAPTAAPFQFRLRKNIIYRGKATVTNGEFSFTFVVPKDINYDIGAGRISCYAESWNTNACGYTDGPLVGGTATDVALDEVGPKVELYINDERFVRGGITDDSPLLYAKLFDENGINTVGSSIGHDLLATLDENTEQAIVLNDLYEADLDTYKSGVVRYRFADLPEGNHTLTLKAWDVFNNSSESTTEFVVASSAELALARVLNYPNPFTTYTEFFFEHNRPCTTLGVQLQVFTVSGRVVKTINRQVACTGYRSEPFPWDGRDDFGDKLGRGVYVYRLSVTTPDGERAEKFEKLVILR